MCSAYSRRRVNRCIGTRLQKRDCEQVIFEMPAEVPFGTTAARSAFLSVRNGDDQ